MNVETQRGWRDGDIVRWSYTQKRLKEKNDGNNGGTTYWAKSRLAIFDKTNFYDMWSTYDRCLIDYNAEEIDYVFEFVANMNDIVKCDRYRLHILERMYKPEDIVNLNHSNSSSSNVYLRAGAKRDICIMRDAYAYIINETEYKIESLQRDLIRTKEEAAALSESNIDEVKVWLW